MVVDEDREALHRKQRVDLMSESSPTGSGCWRTGFRRAASRLAGLKCIEQDGWHLRPGKFLVARNIQVRVGCQGHRLRRRFPYRSPDQGPGSSEKRMPGWPEIRLEDAPTLDSELPVVSPRIPRTKSSVCEQPESACTYSSWRCNCNLTRACSAISCWSSTVLRWAISASRLAVSVSCAT